MRSLASHREHCLSVDLQTWYTRQMPQDISTDAVFRRVDALLSAHPVTSTSDLALRSARFDAGLAFVHFDEGAGGLGADAALQGQVESRFLEAGAEDWSERN